MTPPGQTPGEHIGLSQVFSLIKNNKYILGSVGSVDPVCPYKSFVVQRVQTPGGQWVLIQRNKGNMSFKTDEHLYTISRTEFSKQIGKSREAVKIAMRRGKYADQYIFKNGKYFFKPQEGVGPKRDLSPTDLIKMSPVKRVRRRGSHDIAVKKGRYPNRAFEEANAMKILIKARGKLTPKQLALVPKLEREAVEQDRRENLELARKKNVVPNPMYSQGLFNESRRGYPYTMVPNYYSHQKAYTVKNKGNEWKEEYEKEFPEYY